jgi:hypothetical protein
MDTSRKLLQQSPKVGLEIFTATHPMKQPHPVPPLDVLTHLKTIIPTPSTAAPAPPDGGDIPLTTGNAIAASFLVSALGLTDESPPPVDAPSTVTDADLHDQLCYLLLEGLVAESSGEDGGLGGGLGASPLSNIYRSKLHAFLSWPHSCYNAETMLDFFPLSFKHERALTLGKMGRDREALAVLYGELKSLDLCLDYCDAIWLQRRRAQRGGGGGGGGGVGGGGGGGGQRLPVRITTT